MGRVAKFWHHPASSSAVILTVSFLVLVGAGVLYLINQEAEVLEAKGVELMGLGKLKVEQIRDWRRERYGDAAFVRANRAIPQNIRHIESGVSRDADPQGPMDWMRSMFTNGHYSAISVVTPTGRVISAIPPIKKVHHLHFPSLERCRSAGIIVEDDIQRFGDRDLYMHLYIPIVEVDRHLDSTVVAVVVFEIDPAKELYELTKRWPVPSSSAEVILYRVEQDSVVYLNETIHQKIVPVDFRYPVSDPHLPAAKGARGFTGVTEGIDYRGVEVLAHLAKVPDSPWYVVSKIDRQEVLSGLATHRILVGVVVVLGTLLIGASVARHRKELQRLALAERLKSEGHLAALRKHHGDLMKFANDIIILSDASDRILDVNETACRVYGYTAEELIGRECSSLNEPSERASTQRLLPLLKVRGSDRHEAVHVSKEGRHIPVEVSVRMFEVDGRSYIQRIVRDISERRSFEREVLRLNRIYRVLSDINQLIVREQNEDVLLKESCRIAAELGGFPLVWIGRPDREKRQLIPLESAGSAKSYLDRIVITLDDGPNGQGPSARAFLERRHVTNHDMQTDHRMGPWREAAAEFGLRSSAAFPLMVEHEPWGVLCFYSSEPGFFTSEEIKLLDELSQDVSFAIQSIRSEQRRLAIQEALAEREAQYHAFFNSSPDAILLIDDGGHIVEANDVAVARYQYAREELLKLSVHDLAAPDLRTAVDARLRSSLEGNAEFEWVHRRKDGSLVPVDIHARRVVVRGQSALLCTIRDISDRKRTEALLRISEARYRSLFEESAAGIIVLDGQHAVVDLNAAAGRLLGYERQDLLGASARDLLGADQIERFIREASGVEKGEKHLQEWTHHRRDGRVVVCEVSASRLPDGNFLAVFIDITARREVEDRLRKTEEQFRLLVDNSGEAIFLTRPDGSVLSANPAACRMVGRTEEEIKQLGRNAVMDVGDPRLEPALEERQRTGRFTGELNCVRADGSVFPAMVTSTVFRSSDGVESTSTIIRDISEPKRLEREIRRMVDELNKAQEYAHVGSWSLNAQTRALTMSDEMKRIFGVQRDEAIPPESVFDRFLHPDDRSSAAAMFAELEEGRLPTPRVMRIVRLDGTVRHIWVEIGSILSDPHGGAASVSGFIQDVTERVQQEEALRASEFNLREAQAIAHVGSWTLDDAGQLTWSDELYRIFGLSPTGTQPDLLTFEQVIHPDDRAKVASWIKACRERGSDVDVDYRILRPDGSLRYINGRARRFKGTSEGFLRLSGTFQDVTEKREIEMRLRQSEERFRDMVEQAGAGYFFIDLEGKYRHVNRAWVAMHKYDSAEEVIGKHFELFQVEGALEKAREVFAGIVRNEPAMTSGEFSRRCRDGSIEYHSYSARPVVVSGEVIGIEGFMIDTTEQRRAAAKIEEQLEELRRWFAVALEREERILKLKQEVNELLQTSGMPLRYQIPETPDVD